MHALLGGLEPAARIVVATLFDSLWEAALLAAVVALVLRVLPNVNATTRYAAWCVALAASLLLPLATALPQIAVQQQIPATHASAVHASAMHASVVHAPGASATGTHAAPAVRSQSVVPAAGAPQPAALLRLPQRVHFSLPQYVALAIFAAWCVAAVLLLVRLGFNLWKLERLKSDALPLPVEYRERLERWARADKGEREVRLCTCESIEVPVAVGLFDSMILIPKHLLDSLSQNEIDQIILHELAHLRRADDWTNGFQRFIQALFFFNPAVLFIAQQLDLEREVACDDWVVDQTKEVRPYATCLTKMAEATAWPHRPLAAPGVFVTRRGLSVRVERLLRAGRNIRTSVSFGPTGAIVASLIVLFFILQNVAPSFAFTLEREHSAVAATTNTKIVLLRRESTPAKPAAPAAAAKSQTVALAQPAPAASSHASPAPSASPSRKAVKERVKDIYVPAVDVHVPARHFRVVMPSMPPEPRVYFTMPPSFKSEMSGLSKNISATVSQAMSQAFGAQGGKFDCVGCDYTGQNLSGKSFRGRRLSGPDFSRSDLRNADFSGSVLLGADFSNADLRGANFSNAKLTGCDFSHARIDGINLQGVSIIGCDIDARSLPPAQAAALLRGCRMGCNFEYADLSGQDLRNLDLTGVNFSHANLRGADFSGSHLMGVDFTGAAMDGARFNGARITGSDFSGVDLHGVDLSKAHVEGSKMTGTPR